MGLKVIIIFTVLFSLGGWAQNQQVSIVSEQQGKRITLSAQNHTADTVNVFLMVHAQGYRRSADKPILKNLAPHSTTQMTTLIELSNVDSHYTYDLIVNESLDNKIAIEHEKEIVDIESVLHGKVVLFRLTDCEKCDALIPLLQAQRISHRVFNIDEDPAIYAQFMAFIDKELRVETAIAFPVIWNKSYTIFGYEDLGEVLEMLRE